MSVNPGQIVVSRAGRDAGRKFVVINVIDNLFVEIADGSLRRVEKPKKKKIRHLVSTDEKAEGLLERLERNGRLTNADIRKAIAGLNALRDNE